MPQPAGVQAQLFDTEGNPLSLEGQDATSAIAAGKATFQKGATVHLVTPQGTVGTVPADQAHGDIAKGARVATQDEIHHAIAQAKYGGGAGQAMTGLLGAASGATLGISDAAISALGGREYVEQHAEANPLTWAGSQIAGSVAPMLIPGAEEAGVAGAVEGADALSAAAHTGEAVEGASALARAGQGASAAAKAVGAPTRLVGKLGQGIEDVVHGVLGADGSGSVVANLAKKAIAKGAGSMAEGIVIGGAQQLDEDMLHGDPNINGEKVLAAMGHGALLGLGTGAALTAAGEIGSRVWGRAGPTLGAMADHEAFLATGARKAFTNRAAEIPGGVEGVGRELRDRGLVGFGDTIEEMAPKISAERAKVGEEIGAIRQRADEAGFEGPRVNDVRARIQRDVLPELQKLEGTNAGGIGKVQTLLDDLDHFAGIPKEAEIHSIADANQYAEKLENARLTFQQAAEFRSRLDDVIKWTTNPLAPVNEATEAMKKVRGILEDELEQSGERAAKKMGGSFLDEYKAAKLSYRRLTVADQAAQDAVDRAEANRRISLTDYLGGDIATHAFRAVGGGAIGAAAGGSEGGEGGMLGGLATGALGALAHHAIRTRGNSAAAVVLGKLAALRGIERAAVHVDNQIERGVGGFFREDGRIPVKLREPLEGEAGEHAAETAHRKVTEAAANDNAHVAAIQQAIAPVAPHAPKTASSFQQAALRATVYLAEHAPKSTMRPSITPQFDKPALSDAQKSDYLRVVTAVHDPVSVLKDMELGRVTRAQVDALKMVYPAIYEDVLQRVHERLADLKHPLDYGQKVQLSVLLGVPADETLSPEFVAKMQGTYGPPGGGGQGQQVGPSPKRGAGAKRPLKDDMARDVALSMGHGKGRA